MIRLQRVGRKNQPYFRFVLTESRNSTKSGKFSEVLGFFDFRKNGQHSINAERVKFWMEKGATPTDTVHNYLVKSGIIQGKKRNVASKKNTVKNEPPKEEVEPKAEEPAPTSDSSGEKMTEAPAEEKKE
ncbi:MAG: 30S ribosomal protein S16 [Candidatus Taylorbacteria bacterium RIFCSPLOWO2_12_FULL_43_20]|uniref:30S ribosomal protein S16 n=1 Tax=Candidatus Taylorbacteria bacterium RIFCSPLOWO2_12_FULL_43_20 TaxID=1802332 RepID=A0A1G2P4C1_9BACT|nr:MAG: 30S ribosomal protein S16 [Candidatus Taylorbacteria bacterium RIFCSPHIGHO2_01_FULL_43_120]OHA23514.1 MAG: 30S ribosomal protein S16 [Candidatus Taylorbacteria bacterium RIFCSPHIGHO2_02_FULL_43_55]OHA29962.1 MAG: 30S ribosomal protein S16 [Candidatus Taylorbacteria bacterium RIFCSPHIGHO2_12_FULL_42_34]OHA31661.1 MAG: 30S ribosomal protein S16 [Candidatus Taylorbacteria bacterium RIFCSPLOWO2_01_FULL_43_83]OHA39160.1 MAG: 30S ribosomal protein S16 [Candidatus Taylorbacteria bacterium RIFC